MPYSKVAARARRLTQNRITISRVAIQCNLKLYHEVGDHYLYICDVEQVYANENAEALFAWNGYGKVAPAKLGE